MKNEFENVKKASPLVHNITNYVTVNDCANILLACGASPIMSDALGEVCDITSIATALNINIGTLNERTIPVMHKAGKLSNELNHPVVLDPVGAGASALRTNTALELIENIRFSVIRGNMSEIKTLATGFGNTKGVDADASDKITEDNIESFAQTLKEFSKKTGAVIAVSGVIDIVADKDKAIAIFNGNPMMSSVTGTGCQLSALIAAFVGANPDNIFGATAAAVCAMGLCGEIAYNRMGENDGNASYRNYIIDAMYNLTPDKLSDGAKYKMI